MKITWQELAALTTVAAAVVYLLRRSWIAATRKSGTGCGSCPTCPATDAVAGMPMVSVEQLTKSASPADVP